MAEINKPSGNILNKIWASSGVISVPDDSKIATGWVVEAPPHQTENYLNNKHDTVIAHANQHGGFVWDNQTEYIAGKSWTQGSNGNVYKCLVTNINQNPVTDVAEAYWRPILTGNKLLESSEVSAYMKTMLDDPNKNAAKTTLGFSSLGISITEAGTSFAVRQLLGAGSNGDQLFTSPSSSNSRSILGVVSANDATEGLVQRATDAEAISGVNDTKFITPKKLKLGFAVSLSINGYLKFPSWLGGLILQWGVNGSNVSANVAQIVNYPTPFNNAVFQVVGQYSNDGNPSTKSVVNIYDLTSTNFKYNHSVSGIHSIRWIAVGY